MNQIGIILNNIGSPDTPQPKDVGRYLKEFLMDKEILNMPWFIRYILVHFIIVPRRKWASSQKYKKIWGNQNSPLIEISESFCEKIQKQLGPKFLVKLGMRYGSLSIEQTLAEFKSKNIKQIVLVPLYPQYAQATFLSSVEKTNEILKKLDFTNQLLQVIQSFYQLQSFIDLSAKKLLKEWSPKEWQHIIFSFHGLPESQVKKVQGCLVDSNCCERINACALNCYRAQCFKTAHLIASAAGLTKDQYSVCFQSRVGPAKWISPATDDVVRSLAKKGIQKILVQSPSFVADCLETLEEIALELKNDFIKYGGSDLKLIPCLNDDESWVSEFADYLQQETSFQV